ncbi:MAG TPA: hypothetical protein PKK06_01765 [Phycisphaerae bacterium]|nr:hypothetical protein [Phycisphaerae bacterium]HNU44149.1 hypothetical protein [Phycisphaerae bacterium]
MFIVVAVSLQNLRAPTKARWAQVHIGDTEARVVELLGEPNKQYERDGAPADYYIEGYGRRKRPITAKVLIYLGADMVFYIWLDADGRVEEVFQGVS